MEVCMDTLGWVELHTWPTSILKTPFVLICLSQAMEVCMDTLGWVELHTRPTVVAFIPFLLKWLSWFVRWSSKTFMCNLSKMGRITYVNRCCYTSSLKLVILFTIQTNLLMVPCSGNNHIRDEMIVFYEDFEKPSSIRMENEVRRRYWTLYKITLRNTWMCMYMCNPCYEGVSLVFLVLRRAHLMVG